MLYCNETWKFRCGVWADEGEKVTVEFAGQSISTVAKNGKWMLKLKPMKENSQSQEMTVKGNNILKIKNILIGEVWICCGQSNMEWALSRTIGGEEAVANSTNDQLRLCVIPHNVQMKPVDNVNAKWVLSDPKSTKMNSAVGYYFLSKLQKELNVPVGMLEVAFGGTVIESWLSQEALNVMPNKDKYMDLATMKAEYRIDTGSFANTTYHAFWWTTTESSSTNAIYTYLHFSEPTLTIYPSSKKWGRSIRCVKD